MSTAADRDGLDRRTFLRGAALAAWPLALPRDAALWLPRGDDRLLLVLELEGGNDGLNTVIPLDDERYARARPKLAAVRHGAHALGSGFGLHPGLAGLHARLAAGTAAIVHGVGYQPPDRSHFRSRDIWHTGDPAHVRVDRGTTGWLGRAADLLAAGGAGLPAASVGGLEVPLLLQSRAVVVPSLARVEDYQLLVAGNRDDRRAAVLDLLRERAGDDLAAFAARTAAAAASAAEDFRAALRRYAPRADYPESELGRHLQLVAQLAVAGFGTRIVHVAQSGYDTHARQLPAHDGLLRQLDQAVSAFLTDLDAHGRSEQTVVFVHSEFGRRVAENGSQGTDHGAAAPVVLCGGGVAGGLHGTPSDLDRLVDGDVEATTDFRSLYADVLHWLGLPPAAVLGAGPAPLGLLRA
jgi:uncharacterized protein (DUF1501 family)